VKTGPVGLAVVDEPSPEGHAGPVVNREPRGSVPDDVQDRRLRRSWWSLAAAFGALALLTAVRLVLPGAHAPDFVIAGLIVIVAVAGVLHRRVIADLERGRRMESESFQRILQGLSRSVSPDAIVDAIVEDLGVAAGADHTVVVRLRADARILEATLVSSRAGVPSSTTMLPLTDLEDPGPGRAAADGGRPPIAVSVEREPLGIDTARPGEAGERLRSGAGRETAGPGVATVGGTVPDAAGSAGVFAAGWQDEDPETTGRNRPRIRDRVMSGLRGPANLPLDEWEADGDQQPRPANGSLRRPVAAATAVNPTARAGVGAGAPRTAGAPATAAAQRIADQLAARVRGVYGLRNTLATALVTGQGVVGAIVLSRRTMEGWPPASKRLVLAAAEEASAALERAYSLRQAETRASTDALTGLPNRRYFDEFCGLLARRRRADDAVGVLMIDIDHFKKLNDRYGHPVGDQVLRGVASAIAGAVREGDVPARFGGEEFAVLLRNPGSDVAMEVGERVRAAVGALDLSKFGPKGVTVSVGVAVAGSPDQPISELVDEADHALYRAKRLGRNRVVKAA